MNEETSENLITEKFATLPKVVREAIINSSWQEKVRDIVKKYNLRIDQGMTIEQETFLVMLSIEKPDDFTANLVREAVITEPIAKMISVEIGQKVFDSIKSELVKLTEEKEIVEEVKKEEDLDAESILKDIEEPEKIPTPITISNKISPVIEPRKDIAIVSPNLTTIETSVMPKIVEQKISMPSISEKTKIEAPNKENIKQDNTPKNDPYREPII